MGGGSAEAPGVDFANSFLAPRMWTITKNWSAARADFQQLQRQGKIPVTMNFLSHPGLYRPDLLKSFTYMGYFVGMGALFAIWLNQAFGRREPISLDPKEQVEVRTVSTEQGDIRDVMNCQPYGNNPYTGRFENLAREDADAMAPENLETGMYEN